MFTATRRASSSVSTLACSLGFVRPAVGERLIVGVVHDVSAGHLFGTPGRWEEAGEGIHDGYWGKLPSPRTCRGIFY
jgi:hypothetical protein